MWHSCKAFTFNQFNTPYFAKQKEEAHTQAHSGLQECKEEWLGFFLHSKWYNRFRLKNIILSYFCSVMWRVWIQGTHSAIKDIMSACAGRSLLEVMKWVLEKCAKTVIILLVYTASLGIAHLLLRACTLSEIFRPICINLLAYLCLRSSGSL